MNPPLAQIVAVRPNGKDPRTIVPMGPLAEREAEIAKLRKAGKWAGSDIRPALQLWSASGKCIDPAPKPTPTPES